MEKNIYILLSQTPTKFAKLIRRFGHQKYNHAAISLDESFTEVYSFARPQYNAVLLGRLVKESLTSYTLQLDTAVPVSVLKITVTEEEYAWIKETIEEMYNNSDYIYNLFSVLTYPVTRGFSVQKTFTCVEFVVYILQHLGYMTNKPCCRYKPDELNEELHNHLVYSGDVRECLPSYNLNENYFAPFTLKHFYLSIVAFCTLAVRTCFQRTANYNKY